MLTIPARTSNDPAAGLLAPETPRYAPGEPVLVIGRIRNYVGVVVDFNTALDYPYFVWMYVPVGGKWHGFWRSADELLPLTSDTFLTAQETDALKRRVAVMQS